MGYTDTIAPTYRQPRQLNGHRQIINPGSIGQPRDSNPDAAYAILEVEQMVWEHRRIPYPIELTQERMRKVELPERLIARLERGW